MTDKEVHEIVQRKQLEAYRRAVIASRKRTAYEHSYELRLREAERAAKG